MHVGDRERLQAAKKRTAELAKAEKRREEVDKLFTKLYEDWSAGRITEYNFNMLSQKYQTEQEDLMEQIRHLNAELETEQQNACDAKKWVAILKKYACPTELSAELLNALIEKIIIHEAVKTVNGPKEQEIEIFYRFVGKID